MINYKGFDPSVCTEIYQFRNDTIINDIEYKELFFTREEDLNGGWISTGDFFRENSSNQIFALENDNTEQLYMDFNLEVGDSIQVKKDSEECALVVFAVDSLELMNGEKRKRIRLIRDDEPNPDQPWTGYIDWTQGIGSMSLLSEYLFSCYTDYIYDLLCFYEDGQLMYSNPMHSSCFITHTNDIIKDNSIKVYPNPSNNILNIFSESALEQITIHDLTGKLRKQYLDDRNTIALNDLENGIYILRLETRDSFNVIRLLISH